MDQTQWIHQGCEELMPESLAMLKIIAQSKAAYVAGNFKTAKKAFSDVRKNISSS